jgi:hypothetical protein
MAPPSERGMSWTLNFGNGAADFCSWPRCIDRLLFACEIFAGLSAAAGGVRLHERQPNPTLAAYIRVIEIDGET